jgi:hypothetical protein
MPEKLYNQPAKRQPSNRPAGARLPASQAKGEKARPCRACYKTFIIRQFHIV